MKEQLSAKKAELSERENAVEQQEYPLKNRESIVSGKEVEIAKREGEVESKDVDLKKREAELSKNQKENDLCENDITKREKAFDLMKETALSYAVLEGEVVKHNLTFDLAVKSFYANKEASIQSRIKMVISDCKKIVITFANGFHRYVNAFKDFWNATPAFFRILATKMERENCQTYQDYYQKGLDGNLSEQIAERRWFNDEYENRKKKIDRDYDGYDR